MGASGWSARSQPGCSDRHGSARVGAQLGPVGAGAGPGRPSDLGVSIGRLAGARRAGRTPPAGRADVGFAAAAAAAASASASASSSFGPATPAAWAAYRGTELGRARPCQAGLDLASASASAAASGTPTIDSFGRAPSTAPGSRTTRADLGIAPSRVRGARSAIRGWVESAPAAIMGRRAAGCSKARPGCDRLGCSARKPSAGVAARALMESAGGPFFVGRSQDSGACRPVYAVVGCSQDRGARCPACAVMGRAQDRGACCRPTRAVVGRAFGLARGSAGLVCPRPG